MCQDTGCLGLGKEEGDASDARLGHTVSLNFELLHLAYEALMNVEILWLISTFCFYVWQERVKVGNNYTICVDKLRSYMLQEYQEKQYSQNDKQTLTMTTWLKAQPISKIQTSI